MPNKLSENDYSHSENKDIKQDSSKRILENLQKTYADKGYPKTAKRPAKPENKLRSIAYRKPAVLKHSQKSVAPRKENQQRSFKHEIEKEIKKFEKILLEVLVFYAKNKDFFAFSFLYPQRFKKEMLDKNTEFNALQLRFSEKISDLSRFQRSHGLASDIYKEETFMKAQSEIGSVMEDYKIAIIGKNKGFEFVSLGGLCREVKSEENVNLITADLKKFFVAHKDILFFIHDNLDLLRKFAELFKPTYDACIIKYCSDEMVNKEQKEKRKKRLEEIKQNYEDNLKAKQEAKQRKLDQYIEEHVIDKIVNPDELGVMDEIVNIIDQEKLTEENYQRICRKMIENYRHVFASTGSRKNVSRSTNEVNLYSLLLSYGVSVDTLQKILADKLIVSNLVETIKIEVVRMGLASETFKEDLKNLVLAELKEKYQISKTSSVGLLKPAKPLLITDGKEFEKPDPESKKYKAKKSSKIDDEIIEEKKKATLLLTDGNEEQKVNDKDEKKSHSKFKWGKIFKVFKKEAKKEKKEKRSFSIITPSKRRQG